MKNYSAEKIKAAIQNADAVIIGAGAGLSASAGFTYAGERFEKYFFDFEAKYGFHDMYSGSFTAFESLEENWAYWSRQIFLNRYMNAPKPVYEALLQLVREKNYFVITTNVDHAFQKAGFDKERLFYTQGDYGLWQCSTPCHKSTYDNETQVRQMILAQGFEIAEDGELLLPRDTASTQIKMQVPASLVPLCPKCGAPMRMNLRADNTFVEDAGWHEASARYTEFLRKNVSPANTHIVFLELGVGYNTPGIIKYPFWQMTFDNKNATYICINKGEVQVPEEISSRSILVDGDIGEVLESLLQNRQKQTIHLSNASQK